MPRKTRLKIVITAEATKRLRSRTKQVDDCHEWTGHTNSKGYGKFVAGKSGYQVLVHRYMATLRHGAIPDDMVVDHLCRNTRCVNPDHLEVVTSRTNTVVRGDWGDRDGPGGSEVYEEGMTCRNGLHKLKGWNLVTHPNGVHRCRECHNQTNRDYLRRHAS